MSREAPGALQYIDSNSSPLSGGTVTYSESGNDTLQDTFADNANSVPNPNPVILDSAGFAPDVFLNDKQEYRTTVKRADGSLFLQRDNVVGISSADTAGGTPPHSPSTIYNIPDDVIVSPSLKIFQCIKNNTSGSAPTGPTVEWTEVTRLKIWNTNESYIDNFVVQLDGILYSSRSDGNNGNDPRTVPASWRNISGVGTQTVSLPAQSMIPTEGNPAAIGTEKKFSGGIMSKTMNFAAAASNFSQVSFSPPSWLINVVPDETPIKIFFKWNSTGGSGDVLWTAKAVAVANDAPLTVSFGVATTLVGSQTTADDEIVTGPITVLVKDAAIGSRLVVEVGRIGGDSSDTLTSVVRLEEVIIQFESTSSTDNV